MFQLLLVESVELPFVCFTLFLFFSLMHTSERHIDVCLQKGTYTPRRLDLYKSTGPDLYST